VAAGARHYGAAARQVLARWEREAERIKAGYATPAEREASQHQASPIEEHFSAYLAHLEAKGACPEHRSERNRQLRRLADECGFKRLADLDRGKLESWLTEQARAWMSARTRNTYLGSITAFCNWAADPMSPA
jgi:hypothetical protein